MVTICATSDLHGRVDQLEIFQKEMVKLQPDLIIDNGDFWQGSLSSFYYDYIAKRPNPLFDLANEIGFDALVLGNHEFNEPVSEIRKRQAQCRFPWISCNIGDFAKPYIIKEAKGKRIGVIGASTQMTPVWDEQQFTKDIHFEPAVKKVQQYVSYLRELEQVDYVIVSYHGGFSKCIGNMWSFTANPVENEANALMMIPGIDVLITGHQHLEICTKVGDTVVVQPGANGECYAKITLNDDKHAKLVPLERKTNFEPNVTNWLNEIIGEALDDFTYKGLLESRLKNHPFVNLIHKVQLSYAQTDLSIVDLLYYEEGGFYGDITNADVLKVLSRPNVLQKVWLTGSEIKQFLEDVAATFEVNEKGEIDFSYNVLPEQNPPYLYFYIGGMDYTIAVDQPIGERVIHCLVRGKPIEENRLYSVCLNSYLATGADFPLFRNKEKITISNEIIPLLVLQYIRENSPLKSMDISNFEVKLGCSFV